MLYTVLFWELYFWCGQVANLIYCFTVNPDCELLNSTYNNDMVKVLREQSKSVS